MTFSVLHQTAGEFIRYAIDVDSISHKVQLEMKDI